MKGSLLSKMGTVMHKVTCKKCISYVKLQFCPDMNTDIKNKENKTQLNELNLD